MKLVKKSLFIFKSHLGFLYVGTLDDKMIRKGKETQQKDEEEEIDKNPNSTFFSDTSFKTGATNNMKWSTIYKLIEHGDFANEY